MFAKLNRCAQCDIPDTTYREFQTRVRERNSSGVYPNPNKPIPHFCSERCFKLAVGRFFQKHYLEPASPPLDDRDKRHLNEIDKDMWEPESAIILRSRIAAKEKKYNDENETRLRAAWEWAYSDFEFAWSSALTDNQLKEDMKQHAAELKEKQADWMQQHKQKEQDKLTAPRPIPDEIRFEHSMCLGPSRSGKTTLLQELFLKDMEQDDPPAYVIIDPKGLLVERISRLEMFNPVNGRLRDRLFIIDPTREPLPALGMFTIPKGAPASYQNKLIETFGYIFSTSGAPLSQRMSVPFTYVVRLVFFMGGDMDTLMDILDDNPKERRFQPDIDRFSETDSGAARFFRSDFYTSDFNPTKQQIKTRLHEIIKSHELVKMLGAKANNLSLYECLRQRKIVVVNTAMSQLEVSGSSLLGRYIIACTLAAAFARQEKTPAFLVVDEFQDLADPEQTPRMLRLAGEYKLGISVYFQALDSEELTEKMKTAVSTNTSIKYCASPEGNDLHFMATAMRTDKEFLQTMQKTATHAKFATYVRGIGLTHPFVTEVKLGNIEDQPKMSEVNYQRLLSGNAARLADTPAMKSVAPMPLRKPAPAPVIAPVKPANPQVDDEELPTSWGSGTIKPS